MLRFIGATVMSNVRFGGDAMQVRRDQCRTVTAIMAAALLSVTSASAQTGIISQPQGSAFGADPFIRITIQLRTRIEGVTDLRQDVPDAKAQEAARRTLYDMAANECAILSEIWKAECRLGSITMPPIFLPPTSAAAAPPSMIATAVYELRVRTSGR
jgi:hypothetical protein